MIIVQEKEENKIILKYLTFVFAGLIFFLSCSYVVVSFFKIDSPWKYIASFALGILLTVLFIGDYTDERELRELNKKSKFRSDYNSIAWKSSEFDKFLGRELLELYQDSCDLFEDAYRFKNISDYSFILIPIVKVYEGMLKKIAVSTGLVKEKDWKLNPGLSVNKYFNPIGNEKIFEVLLDKVRDKAVPHIIYSTYQECRNGICHYDSFRDNRIKTIEKADFYRKKIEDAIEKSYKAFIKTN